MSTKIIRAGFVSDANTYVNGLLNFETESIEDAIRYVVGFVDSLKKGWHVSEVKINDDGSIQIDVVKRA